MTLKWHGDKVMAQINRKLVRRLERSAMEWTRTAMQGMAAATGNSRPGGYPGKIKGHLHKNMNHVVIKKDLVAQVGTNVKYGRFLEEGTRSTPGRYVPKIGKRISTGTHPGIKPRPWMTLTNKRMRKKIARIMKRPL